MFIHRSMCLCLSAILFLNIAGCGATASHRSQDSTDTTVEKAQVNSTEEDSRKWWVLDCNHSVIECGGAIVSAPLATAVVYVMLSVVLSGMIACMILTGGSDSCKLSKSKSESTDEKEKQKEEAKEEEK